MDTRIARSRFKLITVAATVFMLSACSMPTLWHSEPALSSEDTPEAEPDVAPVAAPVEMAMGGQVDEAASRQSVRLQPDYPREYTVKKGDTLWDIANMFLKDPWYWPEIWYRNPQVANPHLIYPGDILTLIYVDGKPQIQLSRGEDGVIRRETSATTQTGLKVVKLQPSIHRQSLDEAIPTIPNDAVRQFLTRPRVVTQEQWEAAPYIVGSDDAHLILGADNKIYIRGELDKERIRYSVFRQGKRLEDPDSGDLLGFEIVYAGEARIEQYGSPSSGMLISTSREVLVGDRLLPTDKSTIDQIYFPRVPENEVDGTVVSLFDALFGVAKYQIVVINRGTDAGLEVGHLLATYEKGELARDRFLEHKKVARGEAKKLMVQLPDERSGIMMIFKTFDRVSYGLILNSTRVIHKGDKVGNPR